MDGCLLLRCGLVGAWRGLPRPSDLARNDPLNRHRAARESRQFPHAALLLHSSQTAMSRHFAHDQLGC